jgi:hypothetical protein
MMNTNTSYVHTGLGEAGVHALHSFYHAIYQDKRMQLSSDQQAVAG